MASGSRRGLLVGSVGLGVRVAAGVVAGGSLGRPRALGGRAGRRRLRGRVRARAARRRRRLELRELLLDLGGSGPRAGSRGRRSRPARSAALSGRRLASLRPWRRAIGAWSSRSDVSLTARVSSSTWADEVVALIRHLLGTPRCACSVSALASSTSPCRPSAQMPKPDGDDQQHRRRRDPRPQRSLLARGAVGEAPAAEGGVVGCHAPQRGGGRGEPASPGLGGAPGARPLRQSPFQCPLIDVM